MSKELEALERLKTAPDFMGGTREYRLNLQSNAALMEDYDTIKIYILKARRQENLLKIIIEKGVDVGYLKNCKTLEDYYSNCWDDEVDFNKQLTQKEFNSLKEMLESNE